MSEPQPHLGRGWWRSTCAQLSGQDLVSSPDPSAEGLQGRRVWHPALVPAAQGRCSDRVLIQDLPSATSGTQAAEAAMAGPLYGRGSRGSELRSPCYNPAVLPPCPQGGARAPASGSCHHQPHTVTTISTASPPTGHTHVPGLCSGFPLIMFALLLTSHIICLLWQCHLFQESAWVRTPACLCPASLAWSYSAVGGPGTEACVNEQASE